MKPAAAKSEPPKKRNYETRLVDAEAGDVVAQCEVGMHYESKQDPKAVEWYKKAIIGGDRLAMYRLGRSYLGTGVAADEKQGVSLIEQAAKLGFASAHFEIGRFYKGGLHGYPCDLVKAARSFRAACKVGHVLGTMEFANCLESGLGIEEDEVRAFKLRLWAAERGDLFAQTIVGEEYRDGRLVERDLEKSRKWLSGAAEKGYPEAMLELGRHYDFIAPEKERDKQLAVKWYRKAHEAGDTDATIALAHAVEDPEERVKIYRSAAEKDPHVLSYLAECYLYGEGVKKDVEEGTKLYLAAADRGMKGALTVLANYYKQKKDYENALKYLHMGVERKYGPAMIRLGEAYERGSMVAQDTKEAAKYYRMAVPHSPGFAHSHLARCYKFAIGVEKNLLEAEKHLQEAIKDEHDEASTALAALYFEGDTVLSNIPKGLALLRKQSADRNLYATVELGRCYENGLGVSLDRAEALRLYRKDEDFPAAKTLLGRCYYLGIGVPKDITKAISLWNSARDEGAYDANAWLDEASEHVPAEEVVVHFVNLKSYADKYPCRCMARVAFAYETGREVEIDLDKAYDYYTLAAERYDPYFESDVARFHFYGIGPVEKNEAEALKHFMRAAESGIERGRGQYNVAMCYQGGFGVERNPAKAKEWFAKAKAAGYEGPNTASPP